MGPILYVSLTGLLEPLGQSQVYGYLRGLSREYKVTLITYERSIDWSDSEARGRIEADCERCGIRWLPQRFVSQPRLLSSFHNLSHMFMLVTREVIKNKVSLIHARSYIPGVVALFVNRLSGVPFIFDIRGLWPEELITSGRVRRGSLLHKILLCVERSCLRSATGVVALTRASVDYLYRCYPSELAGKLIVVIPTCADLARFVPASQPPIKRAIGCLGTLLSGWFRVDWLAAFLAVAARRDPGLSFELTTREDPETVRLAIGGDRSVQSRLRVFASPPWLVHEVLQGQIASVMFYAGGEVSELARSPTRMAEVLASGLPVVANEGVGDVANLIRAYRVGVVVNSQSDAEMNKAWEDLQLLLVDPELQSRCRRAAEEVFSLQAGTEAYSALYRRVLSKP